MVRSTMMNSSDIEWVTMFHGGPNKPAPVTVYVYKNRVAISPVYGCNLGCAYCLLKADRFPDFPHAIPTRLADVPASLTALDSIRKEVEGFRISIGDHTDPYLPINTADTVALVSGLASRNYANPVAITSKKSPPQEVLKEIGRSRLRVSQFVSLGDTTGRVEHITVEERLALAERAHSCGIHTVLLLRPLSRAWCDPEEFYPALQKFAGCVDEVVVSGVRLPDPIRAALLEKGLGVETTSGIGHAVAHIQQDFEAAMVAMVVRALPGIVISRTRSCSSNRRYNLPCLPLSAKRHPWPDHARMSRFEDGPLVTKRDWNGFCRLATPPHPERGFSAQQVAALQNVSLMFDASPALSWRLIGGAAEVMLHARPSTCDLDLHIEPDSFEAALERLNTSTRGVTIRSCSGMCSRCSECEIKSIECLLLSQDRMCVCATMDGVAIDLSPATLKPGRTVVRVPLGGIAIPIETEEQETVLSYA